METTLPAPPAEQVWLPLANGGSVYVSSGIPRLVALTDQGGEDALLRREIELVTGCTVVIESRARLPPNPLGFTHAALLVPTRVRALRRWKPIIPTVIRRAWRRATIRAGTASAAPRLVGWRSRSRGSRR